MTDDTKQDGAPEGRSASKAQLGCDTGGLGCCAREATEFMSEIVSSEIDSSANVNWMRCSPELPTYVQRLETRNKELHRRLEILQHFFHSPQSFSIDEFQDIGKTALGVEEYSGRYFCVNASDWRILLRYLWWGVSGKLKRSIPLSSNCVFSGTPSGVSAGKHGYTPTEEP